MIPSSGRPYISFWQMDALADAGVPTGGLLAIQVAMTRLKADSTIGPVPQEWIAKKTRQTEESIRKAFNIAEKAGLLVRVKKGRPGRSALWDYAPLLALHQEAEKEE